MTNIFLKNIDFVYSEYDISSITENIDFPLQNLFVDHKLFSQKENLDLLLKNSKNYPKTYNLGISEECKLFFSLLNKNTSTGNNFDYISKFGNDSSQGNGINLLNNENLQKISRVFKNGENCSKKSNISMLIQEYIKNPVLYKKRKVDFRSY